MPVIIVDASALAALIFGEPQAEEMARQMVGARLVSPSLIWFELANVCVKKAKTHPDQREKIVSAFQLGRSLPIELVDVYHEQVVSLALQTGLTAYDTAYLWLARNLEARLLTLDQTLLKNLG